MRNRGGRLATSLLLALALAAACGVGCGADPALRLEASGLQVFLESDLTLRVRRPPDGRWAVAGPPILCFRGGRRAAAFRRGEVLERSARDLCVRPVADGHAPLLLALHVLPGDPAAVEVRLTGADLEAAEWRFAISFGGGACWAFQGGAERWGEDFVGPLRPGARRENRMGALGGLPAVDAYGPTGGMLLGSLAPAASDLALPVARRADGEVQLGLQARTRGTDAVSFLLVPHAGDFFTPLTAWGEALRAAGVALPRRFPEAAWLQGWETYGYEEGWTVSDVTDRLETLRAMGVGAVTIDSGWYEDFHTGDYVPDPDKFPQGDRSMRRLTDAIHAAGLQARLWWEPGLVEEEADLARRHADWLIRGPDGRPAHAVTATREKGDYYLCPALPPVARLHRDFTRRALNVWGFDGFKMDFLYSAVPCYAPGHRHASPWDSVRAHAGLFAAIRAEAGQAVLETCNCGVAQNLYLMPFNNAFTASDPVGARQVRWRTRVLKAVLGARAPVLGDHVELTRLTGPDEAEREGPPDFASVLGVGAVLQTKYTRLSDADRVLYEKWFRRGAAWGLSRGEYLGGLYALGIDTPEAHAVRVGDSMWYAFFSDGWTSSFSGTVELRGMQPGRRYAVRNAETGVLMAQVSGPRAGLAVRFRNALLLKAEPR